MSQEGISPGTPYINLMSPINNLSPLVDKSQSCGLPKTSEISLQSGKVEEYLQKIQKGEIDDIELEQERWRRRFVEDQLKIALILIQQLSKALEKSKESLNTYQQNDGRKLNFEIKEPKIQESELSKQAQKKNELRFAITSPKAKKMQISAFEAEKNIMAVKYEKENEKWKKKFDNLEVRLASSQEENNILRANMIRMSEEIDAKDENITKLEVQLKDQESPKFHFEGSPISIKDEKDRGDLSFSFQFQENKLLKKQIEELEINLKEKEQIISQFEQRITLESSAKKQINKNTNYEDIYEQLKESIQQIDRYKSLVLGLKDYQKERRQWKVERTNLDQQVQYYRGKLIEEMSKKQVVRIVDKEEVNESDCKSCHVLLKIKEDLEKELSKRGDTLSSLRAKMSMTLALEQQQRKQWQNCIKCFNESNLQ